MKPLPWFVLVSPVTRCAFGACIQQVRNLMRFFGWDMRTA